MRRGISRLRAGGSAASPVYLVDVVGGVAPLYAYGTVKLRSAYAGSCLQVVRPSDSATQDIGFSGQWIDYAALATFLGGQAGHVSIWYDQSGNANDCTQTTDALRPTIEPSGLTGGSPISVGGYPCVVMNSQVLNLPAGLSTSRLAHAAYFVAEPQQADLSHALLELGTGGQAQFFFNTVSGGLGWMRLNPTGGNSSFAPQTRTCVYRAEWGPSAVNLNQNGELQTNGAATAQIMTGGFIGHLTGGTGYDGKSYLAAAIGYGRVLSGAEDVSLRAGLSSAYGVTASPVGRVIFDGDSIVAGATPTSLAYWGYARLAGMAVGPKNIYNLALGGSRLSDSILPNFSTTCGALLGQYSDRRVVLLAAGTNDLTVLGRTAAQIYADTQTYAGNVRSAGGKIIVTTLLPNSGWTAPQQTTWNDFNTLLRNGWSSFADGLCDLQASPVMGSIAAAADTTLYGDGLHPTRLGHRYLYPIAAAALQALL